MSTNKDILSKYGLSENGKKAQVKAAPLPVANDNDTVSDIAAKYGLQTDLSLPVPTLGERIAKTAAGGAKRSAAGYVGTLNFLTNVEADYQAAREKAGIPAGGYKEGNGARTWSSEPTASSARKQTEQTKALGDRIRSSAEADVARAKEGLGTVGNVLVDLGAQGVQQTGDAVLGALTGIGGLPFMLTRVFGQGVQEAQDSGAGIGKQLAYGAGSAAVEGVTERMFGLGSKWAYGKGASDELLKEIVNRAKTSAPVKKALTVAAAAAGESIEEFSAGIVNPALKSIYNGESVGQNYKDMDPADVGYDMLIGGLMGAIGGTGEVVRDTVQARKTKRQGTQAEQETAPVEQETAQTERETGLPSIQNDAAEAWETDDMRLPSIDELNARQNAAQSANKTVNEDPTATPMPGVAKSQTFGNLDGKQDLSLPKIKDVQSKPVERQGAYGKSFDELLQSGEFPNLSHYMGENVQEVGSLPRVDMAYQQELALPKTYNVKPVKASKSKEALRRSLLDAFGVPRGSRAQFSTMIDKAADEITQTGRLSGETRQALIDALYEAGGVYEEADEAYQEARRALKGRKIYVGEDVRANLGDNWNDLRKQAQSAGATLVTDRSKGQGIDVVAAELAEQLGHNIINTDNDLTTQLMQMLDAAELGRGEFVSLRDNAQEMARQYGEDAYDEQLDALERQVDDALRAFEASSGVELDLRRSQQEQLQRQRESLLRTEERRIAREERRAAERAQRRAEQDARREEQRAAREEQRRIAEARHNQRQTEQEEELRMLDTFIQRLSEIPPLPWNAPETDANIPDGMTADEFMRQKAEQSEANERERHRVKGREEFRATPALDKLGVKVSGSVGEYKYTETLVELNKQAKRLKREITRAEKLMKPTAAEKRFAQGVADGIYSLDDAPKSMSSAVVQKLAGYYEARNAANARMLDMVKKRINGAIFEDLEYLFGGKPPVTKKRPSALTLNYRTPTRNMVKIFGDKLGGAINDYLFYPVQDNESEKTRWINQQFDQVRQFEDSEGRERALTEDERRVAQMILEGVNPNEIVAGTEILTALQNAAKEVGQNLAIDENAMAPYIARWQSAAEKLRSGEVDRAIVDKAVETYRKLYADYYDGINDFLVSHGYDTIGWRKNYAPHMQPQEQKSALQTALNGLGINTQVNNLPTEIAGLTATWKPNKRFDPHFLERSGHLTDFDVEKGFSEYVDYLADVLYHTDDIMKLRQFSEFMRRANTRDDTPEYLIGQMQSRYSYTPEQKRAALVANRVIEDSSNLSNAEIEQKYDEYIAKDLEQYETNYGDFVTWLDNYTNNLAGKQSYADRGTESTLGRKWLNPGRRFLQTFSSSKVAGNMSSVLNQSAQLPFIVSELGARNTGRAVVDILMGKDKSFREKSDFLTEKRGVKYLSQTKWQKIMDALFAPASVADETLSAIAVRGKYLEAIENGHSKADAMKIADKYGRSVMASRAKGSKPIAFNNKGILQSMFNMFQIEALNSWEHVTQDKFGSELRAVEKSQGREAAAKQAAAYATKTVLSAFVLNRVAEAIYGGTPAAFDVLGLLTGFLAAGDGDTPNDWLMEMLDNVWEKLFGQRIFATERTENGKPFDYKAAAEDLTYNLGNDIPFVRTAFAIAGVGDQTLPIPNIAGGVKDIGKAAAENGVFSTDTAKALGGLASEVLPGGSQAKKTLLGIEYLARGGEYSGYGENAKLKYAADGSAWEAIQALLFGKNATNAANRYYASGASALSAKQTQLVKELKAGDADPKEVYDLIQDYREIGKEDLDSYTKGIYQRELIRDATLTDAQKIGLYAGLKNSDSVAEQLKNLQKSGMSFEKIADFYDKWASLDELSGEAYTKAKFETVRNASVTEDERRTLYTTFLGADKRKELVALNKANVGLKDWLAYKFNAVGKGKAENLDFIDSMSLSNEQKDAVFLAAGYKESTLKDAPWNQASYALQRTGAPALSLKLPSLSLPELTLKLS